MNTRPLVLVLLVVAACVRPATTPRAASTVQPPSPPPLPVVTAPVAPAPADAGVLTTAEGAARDSSGASFRAAHDSARARTDSGRTDSVTVATADVARRAAEVFGDSIMATVPPPDSAVVGPSWDIDVRSYETTARVERYVRMFSGPAKERIQARLQKGTRYEPMIRAKMKAGGIPEDMYYLALVESGFDPNAYSRAAAVGMWQFMTSTARDMGMRVDWWIDERRDPVRSTTAAVRFLRGLREQFGSLYLAAAAYNGGPGRISRGLTRYADKIEGTTGEDLFFALAETGYLRSETREYVPQLIAAALIAKEPERYGMQLPPEPPFEYDSVMVGPGTPLAAIAHAAGTQVAAIRELNPQIIRGVTPPRDSLKVRVPPGTAAGFADALDAMPRDQRMGWRLVVSKKGEAVATIAKRAGMSTKQLSQFNPKLDRLKSGNLVPGQTLIVPTPAVLAAAATVPDPSIERWGSGSRSGGMHVVKSGETLGAIAKRYHTTTAAIMSANSLRKPLIFPGQSLRLPGSRGGSAKQPSAKTKAAGSRAAKPAAIATKKTAPTSRGQ